MDRAVSTVLAVLLSAVERAGLDMDGATALLADDTMSPTPADVREQIRAFGRKYGVSGVPFFIVNGSVGMSGAQTPEAFLEVFQEVLEEDGE
jgi:predicted DsbA family dithiol-disulfide isomerase